MNSDEPLQSPSDPPGAPDAPPLGPDRCGPEAPRLGILHFMAWTACVAVYLGLTRVLIVPASDEIPVPFMASWAIHAIGAGAALGGLGLLAARRWQGLPFPVHPGEYLLVALGIGAVLGLAAGAVLCVADGSESVEFYASERYLYRQIAAFALVMIGRLVFVWPIVRVRILRWRWLFAALMAHQLFCQLLLCGGPTLATVASQVLFCGVVLLLVAVVRRDHVQGKRYPWTHWLGIAVSLWFNAVRVVWLLGYFFS